jgi:predicted PurR-regulated permease PerM
VHSRLLEVLPPGSLEVDAIRTKALSSAGEMGKRFAGVSTSILGSLTRFMVNSLLLLFVLFFVLRDHDKMIAFIRHALPLSRSQEDILFKEVKDVSKSALLGSLLTAVTQGIVGGFGLWLAGFPGVFWGAVMAFASLIPFVGTALIWAPAALYLAVTGEFEWAGFMLLWGVVVVGSIDNFLRPLFMQGASMSTVVVFFSLIGGLQVFGLMGLIYGPLVFSVALVLFKIYEKEFSGFLDSQDSL